MIEMDEEVKKFKWILLCGIGFLVSGCSALEEVRYSIWGETAEATITRTYETSLHDDLVVEYQFVEADGASRSEHDKIADDSLLPESDRVPVEYFPGVKDSSRLAANRSMMRVYLFGGCIVLFGAAIYRLHDEANTPGYGSRRRRRK